ncbi:MAG: DUF4124 domain-containing protein [Candidatus Accumulibacter sp.]|jgi:hypothetical protein|nr:DUF4124 domain-containing protein [Accumulibacter sp.]
MSSSRRVRFFPVLVLLFAVAVFPTADAQVYKWRGSDGRIVFGDVPPEGVSAEKLPLPELPSSPREAPAGSQAAASWQDQERMFQQRRLYREKEEAKEARAEAEKKKLCASLQSEQKYLEVIRGRRVVRWNSEKNDYEYLTDEDRSAMENRVREAFDRSACN